MSKELESGDKVKYLLGDKWFEGVIHGVRKVDFPDGTQAVLSYLVDTGEDEQSFDVTRDPRAEELGRRYSKHLDNGIDRKKAEALALKSKGLPDEGTYVETVRQPKQIDVRPEDVKPL